VNAFEIGWVVLLSGAGLLETAGVIRDIWAKHHGVDAAQQRWSLSDLVWNYVTVRNKWAPEWVLWTFRVVILGVLMWLIEHFEIGWF
jgi:hypothetical protein